MLLEIAMKTRIRVQCIQHWFGIFWKKKMHMIVWESIALWINILAVTHIFTEFWNT